MLTNQHYIYFCNHCLFCDPKCLKTQIYFGLQEKSLFVWCEFHQKVIGATVNLPTYTQSSEIYEQSYWVGHWPNWLPLQGCVVCKCPPHGARSILQTFQSGTLFNYTGPVAAMGFCIVFPQIPIVFNSQSHRSHLSIYSHGRISPDTHFVQNKKISNHKLIFILQNIVFIETFNPNAGSKHLTLTSTRITIISAHDPSKPLTPKNETLSD
jgi:hypothetical protein